MISWISGSDAAGFFEDEGPAETVSGYSKEELVVLACFEDEPEAGVLEYLDKELLL